MHTSFYTLLRVGGVRSMLVPIDAYTYYKVSLLFYTASLEYLKQIAGPRTVPVELGSRYTDEDWSQKLMTISKFIDSYIIGQVGRLMWPYCTTEPHTQYTPLPFSSSCMSTHCDTYAHQLT